MAPASGDSPILSTAKQPSPDDPRFGWLMLWSLSPTGECCCPFGSSHRMINASYATGTTRDCGTGAGKHPWWVDRRGETLGYRHGSADADPTRAAAEAKWGPCSGARRWGVTLGNVMVIDLDSVPAMQAYYRIARHIPVDKMLGVARTPRGWHVYIDAPGWPQKALNNYMKAWLGDWHGTDATKVTRRGLLMDIRSGPNRYVVWPAVDRYWAELGEFRDEIMFHATGIPAARMVASDGPRKAPWNLSMTPELRAKIDTFEQRAAAITGVRTSAAGAPVVNVNYALRELERHCNYLVQMPPDSGRNNKLNQIAYYPGARAVMAGISEQQVRDRIARAADRAGLEQRETEATINSGLSAGLRNFTAKVS